MVQDMLYCVSMRDNSETEGAGAEMLAAFDYEMSSWRDEESKVIRHTIYFLTPEEADAAYDFVTAEAENWKDFGIVLEDFQRGEVRREDWAESWKLHFKTIVISERLAVKPSWEKYDAPAGQTVLTLDPGMSFGTGQHATTKSCLGAIDKFTQEAAGKTLSFLDAGAGSGILSIAAYKLGCRPVAAFDIDPDTVPVARENAQVNGIPDEDLPFDVAALEEYDCKMQYDIVAANILSSALIAGKKKLLSMVKPGGRLILAGILGTEYPNVRKEFEELGCVELFSEAEKEWRGGSFAVPAED